MLTSQTVVNGQLLDAWIEVWDDKDNSVMMWRSSDLTRLGWTVALKTYGLVISKGGVSMLIRERNTLAPTKNDDLWRYRLCERVFVEIIPFKLAYG